MIRVSTCFTLPRRSKIFSTTSDTRRNLDLYVARSNAPNWFRNGMYLPSQYDAEKNLGIQHTDIQSISRQSVQMNLSVMHCFVTYRLYNGYATSCGEHSNDHYLRIENMKRIETHETLCVEIKITGNV